jgi:hypothetical protein
MLTDEVGLVGPKERGELSAAVDHDGRWVNNTDLRQKKTRLITLKGPTEDIDAVQKVA